MQGALKMPGMKALGNLMQWLSQVWFLEANTNPAVMYQNEWHEHLVDDMVRAALRVQDVRDCTITHSMHNMYLLCHVSPA